MTRAALLPLVMLVFCHVASAQWFWDPPKEVKPVIEALEQAKDYSYIVDLLKNPLVNIPFSNIVKKNTITFFAPNDTIIAALKKKYPKELNDDGIDVGKYHVALPQIKPAELARAKPGSAFPSYLPDSAIIKYIGPEPGVYLGPVGAKTGTDLAKVLGVLYSSDQIVVMAVDNILIPKSVAAKVDAADKENP